MYIYFYGRLTRRLMLRIMVKKKNPYCNNRRFKCKCKKRIKDIVISHPKSSLESYFYVVKLEQFYIMLGKCKRRVLFVDGKVPINDQFLVI